MGATSCCRSQPPKADSGTNFLGRLIELTKWAVPTTLLVLMPKCPVCLAGYVALGTGLGISFTAAAWLRYGMIIVCVAALIYLLAHLLYCLYQRDSHPVS